MADRFPWPNDTGHWSEASDAMMSNVNRFLRDNGYGVALVLGVALLVVGLLVGNPAALVIATVMLVIGVSARPLERFTLGRSGFLLMWQREVAQELQRRIEDRLATSDSGDVVVTPAPARLRLRTFEPTVIIRPLSADEFAKTLIDQIIEPASIGSEEQVNAPTLKREEPRRDAHRDA
jgi:hypothetical protein